MAASVPPFESQATDSAYRFPYQIEFFHRTRSTTRRYFAHRFRRSKSWQQNRWLFDDDARAPLAAGVEKLARAVRSTLGPRGRNAVLDKGWGSPKVTKDGVTVAEDIELDDPYENLGAQLVKEAASKTNDVAGDGTTTATVLAEGIFREGLKMIAAGADPMALQPRHPEGRRSGHRSDREAGRAGRRRRTRSGCSKSPRSPATTTRRSATCWPTPSPRSAKTA